MRNIATLGLLTLDDVGIADTSRVGEEAANLGEIIKVGAPVPATFVVPTTSYAEYLNYPAIKSVLGSCDSSNPEDLKRELLAIPLPPVLERSLQSSYRALSGPRDTFVSVRAGIEKQEALGEEELIYTIKKLWAQHLVRLCLLQASFSLHPLPILVQQMEIRDSEGHFFTSDPYAVDPKTAVVEVDHRRGKERFFLEKGTGRLTRRVVTGIVEEETSLEVVSPLSSWAVTIEKVLGNPHELGWSLHHKTFAFPWIKPLYLRRRVAAITKFWVWVGDVKEIIPNEVEGIITSTADNAAALAKKFPAKPVLLALETIDEDELAIIRRVRHKERRKNLHLILPPVRTVDGLRGAKRAIAGEGLSRGPQLKLYFRVVFPANVVLLDHFLELEVDGVVFDVQNLAQGFLGTQQLVELDDSLLWALNEVQQRCKRDNLDLIYYCDDLTQELVANLLQKGMVQIAVNNTDGKTFHKTLTIMEGEMLEGFSSV